MQLKEHWLLQGSILKDMFSFLKPENPYYYSKGQRTWDEIIFAGLLVAGGVIAGAALYHLLTGGRGLDLAQLKIPGIHTPLFGPSPPVLPVLPSLPPQMPSAVGGAPQFTQPPIAPVSPPPYYPQLQPPPVIGAAYTGPPPPPPEPRPDSAFLATYRTMPDAARTSISYPSYYYYYPVPAPSPNYPSRLSGDISSDFGVDFGRTQVFNKEEWELQRDYDGNLIGITVHRNVRES